MTIKFTKKSIVLASSATVNNNNASIIKVKNKIYTKYFHIELRDSGIGWVLQQKRTDLKSYSIKTNVP